MKTFYIYILLVTIMFSEAVFSAASTAYNYYPPSTSTTLADAACDASNDDFRLKATPSYYGISLKSLYLCQSKPYPESMVPGGSVYAPANGDGFVTDGCVEVFSNTSGSLVEVRDGVSSEPTGTITRPPNGTYPYYLLRVDSEFKFKASLDFTGAETNWPKTGGGNYGSNNGSVRKPFCVTTLGSQESINKSSFAQCYATEAAATAAGEGILTENKISFGTLTTDTFIPDYHNACQALVLPKVTAHSCDDPLGMYVTDSNNQFQTTSSSVTSDNIVAIKKFSTPVTITDQTAGLSIRIDSKRSFLVIKNPECRTLLSANDNSPDFDQVRVGGAGFTVDVIAN